MRNIRIVFIYYIVLTHTDQLMDTFICYR